MIHPFLSLKKLASYSVNSGGAPAEKSRTTCSALCSKVGGGGELEGPGWGLRPFASSITIMEAMATFTSAQHVHGGRTLCGL
jgi:hypothetical protein